MEAAWEECGLSLHAGVDPKVSILHSVGSSKGKSEPCTCMDTASGVPQTRTEGSRVDCSLPVLGEESRAALSYWQGFCASKLLGKTLPASHPILNEENFLSSASGKLLIND